MNKLINLKYLFLDNNLFTGSLKSLKDLNKLEEIDISDTDLDSGLEYLPNSIKNFRCSAKERKDAKVKSIYNLFANEQGEVKTDWNGNIKNFPQKLKDYKQKIAKQKELERELELKHQQEERERKQPKETIRIRREEQEKQKTMASKQKQIQVKPTLNHLLGRGGYGEVYYGKWKLQDVAVKKLYLSLDNISQKDLKDIMNEINLLKDLRNRYIIQYYDTYSDSQELLIIMDFAENGTLTQFINDNVDKEHDWNFNNKFIKQIALGLAYIHQEGVIHRDLKSLNVLLTDGYAAKISDFGLSKTKITSSSQSKNNAVGTPWWMAPEIISNPRNPKYSEQSNIYALGMVIWEIAAKCTVPFKDVDNNLICLCIINGEKETIPSDTPQNIQDIIEGCWETNPQERISLESIVEKTEQTPPQILHQPYNTPNSSKK